MIKRNIKRIKNITAYISAFVMTGSLIFMGDIPKAFAQEINQTESTEVSENTGEQDETGKDEDKNKTEVKGEDVVALAESYVGKVPYVSGGNSLETGTDCTGFVIQIYKQFGLDISAYRSSTGMFENADKYGVYIGTDLSQAKSGDILFTGENNDSVISHAGIYKDGGYIVHQTVPGSSVKVQSLSMRGMGYVKGIVRPYIIGGVRKNAIKGKCQMPYWGEGGGYLIGVESYENPNQSYRYQLLILDCTLLAAGLPAWIYATDLCGVAEGNAFWVIWQPQYGYYWTLFRVYDESGNLIGEECYGFVNAY